MKLLTQKCVVIIIAFYFSFASAEETQIRVLGIVTTGDVSTDADVSVATASIPILVDTWNNSGNPNGTAIILANAGVPEPISISLTGNILQVRDQILNSPELLNLRAEHTADIVIAFIGPQVSGFCGLALQKNWQRFVESDPLSSFEADPTTGLDLRERNGSFLAIVATKGVCIQNQIAAHEFGHLFGGGHVDLPFNVTWDPWLYDDSRAYVEIENYWDPNFQMMFYFGTRTAISEANPQECANATGGTCQTWAKRFSEYNPSDPLALGSDDNDNHATMFTTARSVANYYDYQGGGGGGGGVPLPECSD